jgi:UDPglucose--hexose-1-phosphate uridylyltransferase
MGRIEFEVSRQACRFLDPTRGFEPVEKITEIRRDPLTGRTSHILDMGFEPERPDVEGMVAQARSGFNPFAPDKRDEVTPRFLEDVEGIPGGRLSVGEALVVPNLFPYDRYSAVTVLSDADFIPLDGFSEDLLADAFRADLDYLGRVRETEGGDLRHYSVNWNYMPLAGGSLVHPHHQLIASPLPTNYLKDVEDGLGRYEGDYFGDLVRDEEDGERWVGREGGISWLTGFAPLGHIDVVGVFERRVSLFDLTDEDVRALARALLRIFDYLHAENFVSFNFSLYGLEGADHFTVHCRLSPRFLLSNALGTSDVNYFEISHSESLAFFYPEAAASGLRGRFSASGRGASR